MTLFRYILVLGSIGLAGSAVPVSAQATLSEQDYLEALKIADRKVERQKRLEQGRASALSSSTLRKYFGRYYRMGDTWEVVAFQFDGVSMRRTGDPEHLTPKSGRTGVFRYQVVGLTPGPVPQVTLKITQVRDLGLKTLDARVEHLLLTMTDGLVQNQKRYAFAGSTALTEVSPTGLRSSSTIWELFPLDAPDAESAETQPARSAPEFPEWAQSLVDQAGFKPDLTRSTWLEQDDFFGRPVQMLWQQGDPWPTYLRTANGFAILYKKGNAS